MQEQIKSEKKKSHDGEKYVKSKYYSYVLASFTNELVAIGKTPTDTLSDDEVIKVLKEKQKKEKILLTNI